jgi:Zn-dependent M28 family amino/carboxypeptidase
MDNATGLAGVMAVARALSPRLKSFRRGLRLMFFSVEEWGLTGSTQYVKALPQEARDKIALNVNLDSIAGSPNLAALTSAYPGVEPFLLNIAAATGQSLRTVRPMMANSDHAAFAQAGIPAIRLVAGFDDATAQLRHVLTPADTRDKVSPSELREATMLSAAIVEAACQAEMHEAAAWRVR